jgi:transmembrane sensor
MEINGDLIERFLKNECTADEAEFVVAQLQDHPELLDDFLPMEDWDNIKHSYFLKNDKKEEILEQIRQELSINESRRQKYWWLGIAASLLIMISLGIVLNKRGTPVAEKSDLVYNLVKINYGTDDIPLHIEDGSFILLKAGSEIRYPEHFRGKDRTFYLRGEARFSVAKDRNRPFNVHAGGTVTTAIGTDFTVVARVSDLRTKIVLHEGRVVVRPDRPQRFAHIKDIYLSAGEEVLWNRTTYLAVRSRTGANKFKAAPLLKLAGTTEISLTTITFKNQSLSNIYKMLDQQYTVSIRYKEKDIADRYFTGSFQRDSLAPDHILQETALLNQLHIEKRDSTYYLSQQKNNRQ